MPSRRAITDPASYRLLADHLGLDNPEDLNDDTKTSMAAVVAAGTDLIKKFDKSVLEVNDIGTTPRHFAGACMWVLKMLKIENLKVRYPHGTTLDFLLHRGLARTDGGVRGLTSLSSSPTKKAPEAPPPSDGTEQRDARTTGEQLPPAKRQRHVHWEDGNPSASNGGVMATAEASSDPAEPIPVASGAPSLTVEASSHSPTAFPIEAEIDSQLEKVDALLNVETTDLIIPTGLEGHLVEVASKTIEANRNSATTLAQLPKDELLVRLADFGFSVCVWACA